MDTEWLSAGAQQVVDGGIQVGTDTLCIIIVIIARGNHTLSEYNSPAAYIPLEMGF